VVVMTKLYKLTDSQGRTRGDTQADVLASGPATSQRYISVHGKIRRLFAFFALALVSYRAYGQVVVVPGHSWANAAWLRYEACQNGHNNECDWPSGYQLEFVLTHPGFTCAELVQSFNQDVTTIKTQPDIIVPFAGTNDVLTKVPQGELEQCLATYQQSWQAAFPNATVVMLAIPPMAVMMKVTQGDVRPYIEAVNSDLLGWGWVDIFTPLADQSGWAMLTYMPYGVHIIGDAGWRVAIAAIVNGSGQLKQGNPTTNN
jgi:hypothetical protein